jgi:hypothetical protein
MTEERKYKKDEILIECEQGYNIYNVLKLKPKFFTWESGIRDLGFIAEDAIEKGLDHFVFMITDSLPKIKNESVIAALVAVVKEQQIQLEEYKYRIEVLEKKILKEVPKESEEDNIEKQRREFFEEASNKVLIEASNKILIEASKKALDEVSKETI